MKIMKRNRRKLVMVPELTDEERTAILYALCAERDKVIMTSDLDDPETRAKLETIGGAISWTTTKIHSK